LWKVACSTPQQPEGPADVGDGDEGGRQPPAAGFEGSDELERAEQEQRSENETHDSEHGMQDIRLDEGDARQRGPQAREQIAEVLADRDTEVPIQCLERDVDRVLGSGTRMSG
jgi:hypothetical protein